MAPIPHPTLDAFNAIFEKFYQTIHVLLDRDPGCCPDPGISGTRLRVVGEVRRVAQAETGSGPPSGEGGRSRDPAVMKETWARRAPLLVRDVTEEGQQLTEWEHCMYTLQILVFCNLTLWKYSKPVCDDCVSFRRINHLVLYYIHSSSVYTLMTNCRVPKNTSLIDVTYIRHQIFFFPICQYSCSYSHPCPLSYSCTVSAIKLGRSSTKYCKLPVAPRAKRFFCQKLCVLQWYWEIFISLRPKLFVWHHIQARLPSRSPAVWFKLLNFDLMMPSNVYMYEYMNKYFF